MPTSVSVPATKNACFITNTLSQTLPRPRPAVVNLIAGWQLTLFAEVFVSDFKRHNFASPRQTGRTAGVHVVRPQGFQLPRQRHKLRVMQHTLLRVPRSEERRVGIEA